MGVMGIIVLILLGSTFGTVSTGERGVETRLGKVVGTIQPGFYAKLPFLEKVIRMDVHTQSLITTKDKPMTAASNDLQDTRLAVVVNYHIEPSMAADIFSQYGDTQTYYLNIVDPLITATIKSVASQYTAADQIQKRGEMSQKALDTLQIAFKDKGVFIEKADITDISFSDSFTKAIEGKVTAVQNAEAAKNTLTQVQFEADQRVAQAEGEAKAIAIQSQAIESQGGKNYVQLQAIQKWDGHLPTQMIPGSSVPFLNLKQ